MYKNYMRVMLIFLFVFIIFFSYVFTQLSDTNISVKYKQKPWFNHQKNITYKRVDKLFDLGVVDVNSDQYLDIYTSNHSSKQLLLINNKQGEFSPSKISEFQLDQFSDFPGLEDNNISPITSKPGLYIYWKNKYLVVKNNLVDNASSVDGVLEIFTSTQIKAKNNGFNINKSKKNTKRGSIKNIIEFSSKNKNSWFKLKAPSSAPIKVSINSNIPLDNIFIGSKLVNPNSTSFTLSLRDRHGIAWTDYNGDYLIDLFISRGGLSGKMAEYPYEFYDELLINNEDTHFKDIIINSGIEKKSCPARQTSWVDFNHDSLLDIYIVCSNQTSQSKQRNPNLLYMQKDDGTFIDVATEMNLAFPENGTFLWLDANNDKNIDLFWVNDDGFWLYINDNQTFKSQFIGNLTTTGKNKRKIFSKFKLTVSDYDNDGDLDIFCIFPEGDAFFEYNNNTFTMVDPKSKGLPAKGFAANWVDFDNDGLIDLHILPNGVYHQTPDHNFQATHLLEIDSDRLKDAKATWFDYNNDGFRDLLLATNYASIIPSWLVKVLVKIGILDTIDTSWNISVYSNLNNSNHWLELELVGTSRNPQGLDTQVEITSGNNTTLHTVGESEGSHYSQGHYRLYFGMGDQEIIDLIKVKWSDGFVQEIRNVLGDQLQTITR